MDIGSYLDGLAARGRHHFTAAEAAAAMGSFPVAARAAIRRLSEKGQVAMPCRGFFLVVPSEYRAPGCLPAESERSPLPWAQRLGYRLEFVGTRELAVPLFEHVAVQTREYVPLRPRKTLGRASRVPRWRLLVNERVEADL